MENNHYDSTEDTLHHIKFVQRLISKVINELYERSKEHDQSKLEEPEKSKFNEVTPKLKNLTYGSKEYNESLKELKIALQHHYQNNRHHPEHFKNGIRDMNLIDVVEMFCDWYAATKRHDDGDIYNSIDINKERFNISEDLTQIFKNTVSYMNQNNYMIRKANKKEIKESIDINDFIEFVDDGSIIDDDGFIKNVIIDDYITNIHINNWMIDSINSSNNYTLDDLLKLQDLGKNVKIQWINK